MNISLLYSLTKNDFRQKYLGSYLGIAWAFIQPVITVLIFWFVFQIGFKSQPVNDVPFILWLIAGMFPWFFFADAVANATSAVTDNAYLVKKIVFRVGFLPIIKIFSALVVHLFFILFMYALFMVYGYSFDFHWLQVFYYLGAMMMFILGLTYMTSAVVVFFKDMGQLVTMVLQFGFWMTPIFWALSTIPEKYHFWIELNPIAYIVAGYRDSMINHIWFWEKPMMGLYFWMVTGVMIWIGWRTFKKLKPHFADVM